ncbi:MAG: diphosphate--fructose-6-phosphate 1-phosphotransferase, partial [Thermomonas sp.]
DLEQTITIDHKAVEYALAGKNSVMPVIVRTSDSPYRWTVEAAPLSKIANREKTMPAGFIRKDGFGITAAARRYLSPLIQGEAYPPYGEDGLPDYLASFE